MTRAGGRAARRRSFAVRRIRSRLVAVLGVTAIVVGTGGAALAAIDTPPHAVTLTGGKSHFYDLYLPIVGSSSYAVYTDQPYPFQNETLLVRTSKAKTSTLAFDPNDDVEPTSLAGHSLSGADEFAATGNGLIPDAAEWWTAPSGAHGVLVMSGPDAYLSSTPDGVLAIGPSGALQDHPTAGGSTRKLGTPFPNATSSAPPVAVAGDDGVVLEFRSRFRYMAWSNPGVFIALDVGSTGETNLFCTSIGANSAGCGGTDATNHPLVIRVPLNGTAPVVTQLDKSACPSEIYVTAAVTAWSDGCVRTVNSVPAGAGMPTSSGPAYIQEGVGLIGAYGRLVMAVGPGGHYAVDEGAAAAGGWQQLVAPKRSATVALHLALTAGRVAYDSDQTAGATTWSRLVTSTSGGLTVGAATSIGHPGTGADIDVTGDPRLSASGVGTAAAGMAHSISISSPVRTTTIVTRQPATGVDLSGDRLVYHLGPNQPPLLYDLRTGKTTSITGAIAAAVWGNYLSYVDADGSVWREPLSGGGPAVKLRGTVPTKQRSGLVARISEYADEVVWQIVASKPAIVIHEAYRDAATMAPAISLLGTDAPQAATSDGILELHDTGTRATYYLQRYGSAHHARLLSVSDTGLLPAAPDGVAVDGDLIAWIDGADRARVAPLPVAASPQPPRYLGDPLAPTTATPTTKAPWQAFIPMSAAMTSCQVQIRAGSTVERTLKCAAADAVLGDASVHWDGRDASGHKVPAGHYEWRLEASNADGSALAADGTSSPVEGKVTVG